MKLLNSLYTVLSETSTDVTSQIYAIKLNDENFIYKAHFPGEPITPGVCILQIALELLQKTINLPLQVLTVKNVKFIRVIIPNETPEVTYTLQKIVIEEDIVKCQVLVTNKDEIFAKLSLICKICN